MARRSLVAFGREVLTETVTLASKEWWEKIKPTVPSETLQQSGFVEFRSVGKVWIVLPYYWAWYIHEGHGPIEARPGKPGRRASPPSVRVGSAFLRFYPPGVPDPRYPSGPPRTLDDVRYHTTGKGGTLEKNRGVYIQVRFFRKKVGSKFFTSPQAQALLERIMQEKALSAIGARVLRLVPKVRTTIRASL